MRFTSLASTTLAFGLATALSTLSMGLLASPSAAATPAPPAIHADLLADFDRASDKLNQLAEAVPAEEFDHRPTLAVRSVSESLMHVASTNFFLAETLGVALPDDLPDDLEGSVTQKSDAIAWLERSQDAMRRALAAETDFDRSMRLFGSDRSARTVYLIALGHTHEHLGQMIAYVRALGMVPPWSQPQN